MTGTRTKHILAIEMRLGIDIGGTTINVGLVENGRIVRSRTFSSFSGDATKAETINYLSGIISKMLVPEVESIGIGVPTIVDPVMGIVYQAVNIPSWDEVHLKDELEARHGIPVHVNNDSNCFALGAAAKLGKTYPVMVGITLGTGLGMGVVKDGELFCGTRCGVGELGSAQYNGADYETFCSKKFFTENGWGGKEASDEADLGNPRAVEIENEFGTHLGNLLALVMFAYDPDCIVLGGGVAHSFRHFKESMMAALRSGYPYPLDFLRIEAMPGGDTSILGAANLK